MSDSVGGRADRTRRDVVVAAIECWSLDNAASLGEIAAAAGVGRTTLNRHFAGRSELVAAVDAECRARFVAAVRRARPDEDRGLVALLRLCTEILQLGEVLGLVFADNALVDPDTWYAEGDNPVELVVTRGYADGSIAVDLPPEWVGTLVWTTLFAAALVVRSEQLTGHEAAVLLGRTLTSGIAARPGG